MDEALVTRVTEAVWQKLSAKPRALCIGRLPEGEYDFLPVTEAPYEAVVLASLSPAELLAMPTDPVCQALLTGLPVYLREEGLEHRNHAGTAAKGLYSLLLSKERQLRALGVQSLDKSRQRCLLTAQDVRRMKEKGLPLPAHARLTPLARDIWEGKA